MADIFLFTMDKKDCVTAWTRIKTVCEDGCEINASNVYKKKSWGEITLERFRSNDKKTTSRFAASSTTLILNAI